MPAEAPFPEVSGRRPIRLTPNTVPSFYPGSGRLRAFRRDTTLPETDPEDWVASTTPRTGMYPRGLTTLTDGTRLADALAAHPHNWFGDEHLSRHGTAPGLLVKLLDAGQRLPLHIHPTRGHARQHLHSPHGKTEAWVVLHAEPNASIHLGFSRDIDPAELCDWVRRQQAGELLAATNQVPVTAGDVLLCPAGVPHAIGEGILVIELQEMSDFSIMLEWDGYPLDPADAFLGLDEAVALDAVERRAILDEGLADLTGRRLRSPETADTGTTSLLPAGADPFFRADQIIPGPDDEPLTQGFSILIVNHGSGSLTTDAGDTLTVSAGQIYLIPHAAGPTRLTGQLSAVRCRPA